MVNDGLIAIVHSSPTLFVTQIGSGAVNHGEIALSSQ